MLRYLKLQVIKLLILCTSCLAMQACSRSQNKKFEREDYLFRYLKDIHGLNFEATDTSLYSIVLLQGNICVLCNDEANALLEKLYKSNIYKSAWLFAQKEDEQLRARYGNYPRLELLVDSSQAWMRYGMHQARHLFFLVRAGRIEFWSDFKDDKAAKLEKKLSL